MDRLRAKAVAVTMLCGLLLAGCGVRDQQTPRATVVKMYESLKTGGKAAFVSCFDAADNDVRSLEAIVSSVSASRELEQVFRRRFGKDSWEKYAAEVWMRIPVYEKPDLSTLEVEVEGNTARARREGIPGQLQLVKKGRVWKILPSGMLPAGDEREPWVKRMEAVTVAVGETQPEIRRAGATPETVLKKLDEELIRARRPQSSRTP